MRVLDPPSTACGGEARFYADAYDPLATYRRLRDAGLLGAHSYLHVTADRAEIGWAPVARLCLLDHDPAPDWRARLQALADDAAALERKAFGCVGFDSVDQASGILPDGSQRGWPLVEFIIPGEQVIFDGGAVVHRTQTSVDLGR